MSAVAAPASEPLDPVAHFYRQLQQVTARIHATDHLEDIMLEASAGLCTLLNADRLTLYAVADDGAAIVSRVKTGLHTSRALRLPIGPQSLAGFVAQTRQIVNIADAYDETALRRIHRDLRHLREVDERSGYRCREMLVLPLVEGNELQGVLQLINHKAGRPFAGREVDGAQELCKTLATAIRLRQRRAETAHRRRATKYDGLLADGVMTPDELHRCIQRAREEAGSVEQMLVAQYHVRPAQIGQSLAKFFGVAYEPFHPGRIRSELLHGALRREFVEEQGWLPLEQGQEGLLVLCLDPEAVRGSRIVPQVFRGMGKIAWRVTTQSEFAQTVGQLYGGAGGGGESICELLSDLGAPLDDDISGESLLESGAADNELVKFVNKVIVDAWHQRASDIHVEPQPGKGKTAIRFRVDGQLRPYVEVPAQFRQALVTRLKIMCDLDISERRKPQDGKIAFRKFGPLDIELRVATVPTAGGVEDVVIRLLASGEPMPMDRLELAPDILERLKALVSQPHGLFYVCGPTGSGKTTTLHSILGFRNTPDAKIWTAEDPVEITQRGLRQVQVHRKAGLDFAALMRAFLRADPDIIMVGESRDRETVAMGVEASLTGHLVMSTLHTNSAPESIVRLLDMGMDPFNFSDALLGVLAQRLARRLCDCKQAWQPEAEEMRAFVAEYTEPLRATAAWRADPSGQARGLYEGWMQRWGHEGRLRLWRAVGCAACHGSGYRGRIGLHELLVADAMVKRLVQERASVNALFVAGLETGMRTLRMDGMEKALQGLTDLVQVRAACIR